jgi:putative ABC transport system permease protein
VWLDDTRRDLQYAVRVLRRAPGFTLAIVLTLAVGMGANTAIFSVIRGVVLRPLGYPDADRLVVVLGRWTDTGRTMSNLAGGDEMDVRALGEFEAFAHYYGGAMGVQLEDHAEFAGTQLVHPAFFRVFGVLPEAGRAFGRDDADGHDRVGRGA